MNQEDYLKKRGLIMTSKLPSKVVWAVTLIAFVVGFVGRKMEWF